MADQFTLTQNYSIDVILPELMADEMEVESDPVLKALPPTFENVDMVKWDQFEAGYGLLGLRGLGGEPDVVGAPGIRQYAVAPGYYGERAVLDETEMTKAREPGSPNLPADPAERIGLIVQYQAEKSVRRVVKTNIDLLLTGKFRNVDARGRVVHTDAIENYRTVAVAGGTLPDGAQLGPGWATSPDSATPIQDLLNIQNYLEKGTSSEFGPDSELVCQPAVLIDLFATKQIRDSYRDRYGASVIGAEQLNQLLMGFGLPKLVPYKKGYFPTIEDSVARTNFTRLMPVKSLIWLGTRPKGQRLGKFVFTRNVGLNPPAGAPASPYKSPVAGKFPWADGLYIQLDYIAKMPFRYELDVAFNGGPVVHFGSAAAGITYT